MAMYITKYIFVLHLKNPSAVTEDFWSIFVDLLIHSLAGIFSFVIFYHDQRKPVNFYACADLDMTPVVHLPRRSYGMAEVASLALIVYVQIRILFFKAKAVKSHQTSYSISKQKSLVSFSSTVIPIITLGFVALYTVKINSLSHTDVNEYPNSLYMQIFQLLVPNITALISSMTYYFEHKALRRAIFEIFREKFKINFVYPVQT